MAATIITLEDLQNFKQELLTEIQKLLSQRQTTPAPKQFDYSSPDAAMKRRKEKEKKRTSNLNDSIMSHTGENEQALQKIIDFIRLSLVVLLLHFYYFCYQSLTSWGLTFQIVDEIIKSIANTGLFLGIYKSKLFILGYERGPFFIGSVESSGVLPLPSIPKRVM